MAILYLDLTLDLLLWNQAVCPGSLIHARLPVTVSLFAHVLDFVQQLDG